MDLDYNDNHQITLDSLLEDADLQAELRALGWNETFENHRSPPTETMKAAGISAKTKSSNNTSNSYRSTKNNKSDTMSGAQIQQSPDFSLIESHFEVQSIEKIGLIDENAIELEEGDLFDPDLLAMYHELSEDRKGLQHQQPERIPQIAAAPPSSLETVQRSASRTLVDSKEVQNATNELFKSSAITPEEATKKALQLKREGNTEEALKWFRLSKQLENSKNNDSSNPSKAALNPSLKLTQPAAAKASSAGAIRSNPPPAAPPKPPRPSSVPTAQVSTTQLAKTDSARLKGSTVDAPQSSEKSTNSNPKSLLEKDQLTLFESALIEASNLYLKDAKRFKESNQTKLAVEKMKKYKYYQQELSVLQSRKQMGVLSIPLFAWRTHRLEEKVENVDIAENEMRIQIQGLYNIEGLITSQNHKTIGLTLNFGRGSGGSEGKEKEDDVLEVSPIKSENSSSVEYNFTRTLPILKRSKLAQQLYSRKKITIELLMNKGLFRGQYSVAMAILPLAELLQKCSTGGDLPLYSIEKSSDGANKKGKLIGGVLRMTVTIRTPLVSPEMRITEERELVIEAWPSASAPSSQLPPTPLRHLSSIFASPPAPPTETTSASISNVNSSKLAELEKQLTAKEISDPESVDFIESNDVLENEIQSLEQEFASGRIKEEEQIISKRMQLQMLQAKLQILVFSVQNETLSLEDYLQRLKARIERDKKILFYQKYLNTVESKAIAIKFMKRIKIMESEVTNATAADEAEERP